MALRQLALDKSDHGFTDLCQIFQRDRSQRHPAKLLLKYRRDRLPSRSQHVGKGSITTQQIHEKDLE